MLKFDTLPPQPGGVHLHEVVHDKFRIHDIMTGQVIGNLVAAQLVELGADSSDVYQIINELVAELPETTSKNQINRMGPRELFSKGAYRQLEKLEHAEV